MCGLYSWSGGERSRERVGLLGSSFYGFLYNNPDHAQGRSPVHFVSMYVEDLRDSDRIEDLVEI